MYQSSDAETHSWVSDGRPHGHIPVWTMACYHRGGQTPVEQLAAISVTADRRPPRRQPT